MDGQDQRDWNDCGERYRDADDGLTSTYCQRFQHPVYPCKNLRGYGCV